MDISNRQGRFYPPYENNVNAAILRGMTTDLDIETIRESLRRIMDKKKLKPTTVSLKIGKNKSLVKDFLEKTGDVRISTLIKLSSALDVTLEDILASPRVPIVGRIGAGGSIIFEDAGVEDYVAHPPGISGTIVALVVQGESMLPKYNDGDIIYIQRVYEGYLPEYIGLDCAVRLTTGETYIKQFTGGTSAGKFTLLSLNAAPMIDVEIEWATPVLFIMPQRSRYLMD